MNWLQFARKHWTQSFASYRTYTISLGVIIFVVFLFSSIAVHPVLAAGISSRLNLSTGFRIFSYILVGLGLFYAWYANGFFLRRRAGELGLLSLLGLTRGSLSLWFLVEGAFSSLVALGIGLGLGLVFGQFSFMILERLMAGVHKVGFMISVEALGLSVLTALALMLVHVLSGVALVFRSRLLKLFKTRRSPERPARGNPVLGLLGLGCIILSYVLSLSVKEISFTTLAPWIVIFNVAGTFLFIRHALAIILDLIRRRPLHTRSGVVLVALAQLAFRLRRNARMLGLVTVLSTATICGMGTALYTYSISSLSLDAMCPMSVQMANPTAENRAKVLEILARDPDVQTATISQYPVKAVFDTKEERTAILVAPLSAAPAWAALCRVNLPELPPGTALATIPRGPALENQDYTTLHLEVPGAKAISVPIGNTMPLLNSGSLTEMRPLFFLPDASFAVAREQGLISDANTLAMQGFASTDETTLNTLADWLSTSYVEAAEGKEEPDWISSRTLDARIIYGVLGVILFIAAFSSLVLLIACGSIMSFKQTMDLEDDAERYQLLGAIGFSERRIRQVFVIQLGLFFSLPFVLGVIHAIFALRVLGRFMFVPIDWYTLVVCLVYALHMAVFFVSTLRNAENITHRSRLQGFGV